jgi:ankyrin repeat protein
MTALHTAASHWLLESCELLLTASKGRVLHQRVGGMAPLQLAVAAGQVQVVQLMLKHGADLESVQGENLLHHTVSTDVPVAPGCKRDSLPMLRYLLSKGLEVNARSTKGSTPLYAAVVHTMLRLCSYLNMLLTAI